MCVCVCVPPNHVLSALMEEKNLISLGPVESDSCERQLIKCCVNTHYSIRKYISSIVFDRKMTVINK